MINKREEVKFFPSGRAIVFELEENPSENTSDLHNFLINMDRSLTENRSQTFARISGTATHLDTSVTRTQDSVDLLIGESKVEKSPSKTLVHQQTSK